MFVSTCRRSAASCGATTAWLQPRRLASANHHHSYFRSQPAGLRLRRLQDPSSWMMAATHASLGGQAMCAQRHAVSSGPAYGSIPADIEGSQHAKRPLESELRGAGPAAGSEEAQAHAEAITSQVAGYNPWEVMGLKAGASTQTIRLRYHELMKEVHPDLAADGQGNIARLNQINKAYELITKSPTLDRRYRQLVSDTQYFYYRFLPEWMARNVDEMPRYWSWVKWRTPTGFHIFLMCCGFYMLGRFYAAFPLLTTVFVMSALTDVLLHTMIAPATLSMLFLYSIMAYRSYDMAWLTSPKGFLRRELGY